MESTSHGFPMWRENGRSETWKTNARIKKLFSDLQTLVDFLRTSQAVLHFSVCFLVGGNYRNRSTHIQASIINFVWRLFTHCLLLVVRESRASLFIALRAIFAKQNFCFFLMKSILSELYVHGEGDDDWRLLNEKFHHHKSLKWLRE